MPAASPRRQASPLDMTLTSARTTRRRRAALPGLGCSCRDGDEKAAAAAKETAVRYIEPAAVGMRTEARSDARGPSSDSRPANTIRQAGRVGAGRRKVQAGVEESPRPGAAAVGEGSGGAVSCRGIPVLQKKRGKESEAAW